MEPSRHLFLLVILLGDVGARVLVTPSPMCITKITRDVFIRSGVELIEVGIPLLSIPTDLSACAKEGLRMVNETLAGMVSGMVEHINHRDSVRSDYQPPSRNKRFIVALGLALLGILTATSIGLSAEALAEAAENRREIQNLKGDVSKLRDSLAGVLGITKQLVEAIGYIQDYIGTFIVPALKELDCRTQQTEIIARAALLLHKVEPIITHLSNDPDSAKFPASMASLGIQKRLEGLMKGLSDTYQFYEGDPLGWLGDSVVTVTGYDYGSATVWALITLPILTRLQDAEIHKVSCLCRNTAGSPRPRRADIEGSYLLVSGELFKTSPETISDKRTKAAVIVWDVVILEESVRNCLNGTHHESCLYTSCPYSIWSYIFQAGGNYFVNSEEVTPKCLNPPRRLAGREISPGITVIDPRNCSEWLYSTTKIISHADIVLNFTVAPIGSLLPPAVLPIKEFINPLNITRAEEDIKEINKTLNSIVETLVPDHALIWLITLTCVVAVNTIVLILGTMRIFGCQRPRRRKAKSTGQSVAIQ